MFFRTRFSASAITAFSAIVIAPNTWPAAENYWVCSRPSHHRLPTTGSAASNSLGSIRSSAPNAIVARWCVSPSFPWPGSPASRTPHEQVTHTPVLNCQSAANVNTVHLTTFACYSVLGRWASGGRLFHARYHRGIHRARDGGLRRSPAAVAGRVLWPGDLPLLRRSCSSASTAAECTIEGHLLQSGDPGTISFLPDL